MSSNFSKTLVVIIFIFTVFNTIGIGIYLGDRQKIRNQIKELKNSFVIPDSESSDSVKRKMVPSNTVGVAYMTLRDSLKALYDEAEIRLDSTVATNDNLQGEKNDLQKEIEFRKSEIRKILNNRKSSTAELKRTKLLIIELNKKIEELMSQTQFN